MFRFSAADFTFPMLSHAKALQVVALLDFKFVDIGLFEGRSHIQPSDQLDRPEQKGKALATLAQDAGLTVSDIFFQAHTDFTRCAINHPDETIRYEQREMFSRCMDYVRAVDCTHFSALPGADFGTPDSRKLCVEELAWRVEKACDAGITYAVEPHLGSIIPTPDTALAMLGDVPGLTIILDHSHYTYQGIPAEAVQPLFSYASHVHVRGAAEGEMQTPVRCSGTDFGEVATQLIEVGYTGVVCIEYTYTEWENCYRTDNISESIMLRRIFEEKLGLKETTCATH